MKKTKNYIYNLKKYLSKKDRRFNNIFITPVVAFNRKNTNIDAIHSFEDGYIYIDEIAKYIQYSSNNSNTELEWIKDGLKKLPTWDTVTTSSNENIYGIMEGEYIEVYTYDNKKINILYNEILNIKIERKSVFSKEDILVVNFVSGEVEKYKNIRGTIILNKFGDLQEHKISNLKYINFGTNALRRDIYI